MKSINKNLLLDGYVMLIVALSGLIRISYSSTNSITQDESTMVLFSRGVSERGYPFLRQTVGDFIISTYELIPYPIALSTLLFGHTETAVRLPSTLFAMLTVYFIYYYGKKLFDVRTAIIAISLFCLLPWSIYWGANAFYPSQLQCFALLCIMSVHALLTKDKLQQSDYIKVFLFFIFMYFSWEGSGVLLLVFSITALLLKFGQWQWLANKQAVILGLLIVFIVIFQLTYRTSLREPYNVLGNTQSNLNALSLAFLNSDFDPFFYIRSLFSESHVLIYALFGISLFFLKKSWNLRYLFCIVFLSVLMLNFFLGYYALRYIYFLLPLILLIVSNTSVKLLDSLMLPSDKSKLAYLLMLLLMVGVASPWGIQATDLGDFLQNNRPFELRRELSGFRFRSVNLALQQHYQKGDILVVQAPFPTGAYLGIEGDYFLQAHTVMPIMYDHSNPSLYLDKWHGNPVLTSIDALNDVMQSHPRIWIVSAPDGPSKLSYGKEMSDYLDKHFCVVKESLDARLLLWENPLFVKRTDCPIT